MSGAFVFVCDVKVCTRQGTVSTLILDFSFTRMQLITAQNSSLGSAAKAMKTHQCVCKTS